MSSASVPRVVPRNLNGTALHIEHYPRTDQDRTCWPASALSHPADRTPVRRAERDLMLELYRVRISRRLMIPPR